MFGTNPHLKKLAEKSNGRKMKFSVTVLFTDTATGVPKNDEDGELLFQMMIMDG